MVARETFVELVAVPASHYWEASRRPLASLLFVAPLLAAYEGGLLLLGPQAMRNGADLWLRWSLEHMGFGQYLLLPFMTCGLLLAWHHLRRDDWHVAGSTLYGMAAESILLGAALLVLAHAFRAFWNAPLFSVAALEPESAGRLVSYLGAGIYEELLFRLMLLPFLAMLARGLGLTRRTALASAVCAGSLLFAAAHYQLNLDLGPLHFTTSYGDVFELSTFSFRAAAGCFFSALFLLRGFGVAVGAHALYDIFVIC